MEVHREDSSMAIREFKQGTMMETNDSTKQEEYGVKEMECT